VPSCLRTEVLLHAGATSWLFTPGKFKFQNLFFYHEDTKARRYTKRKPDGCAEPFVKLRALVASWPFIAGVFKFQSFFFTAKLHEGKYGKNFVSFSALVSSWLFIRGTSKF